MVFRDKHSEYYGIILHPSFECSDALLKNFIIDKTFENGRKIVEEPSMSPGDASSKDSVASSKDSVANTKDSK